MTVIAVSIRQVLADATHDDHITLHGNPWIGSIAAPSLARDRYDFILSAYRAFFVRAEEKRRQSNIFPDLTLENPINALNKDLAEFAGHAPVEPRLPSKCTATPAALLGLLYVLHGSGFGARVLGKNVGKALPEAPLHFLSTGTPPTLWRGLVAELENLRGDENGQQQAIASAKFAFIAFGQFVTEYCETAYPRALSH